MSALTAKLDSAAYRDVRRPPAGAVSQSGETPTTLAGEGHGASHRRHDLDWLRIGLFGLLIWYHYTAYLLNIERDRGAAVDLNPVFGLALAVVHEWRLGALFLISGMGTAFAFLHRSWRAYVRERVLRLGIPFFFAAYVLLGVAFVPRFPDLWSWQELEHVWFLWNLLVYSVLLTPLFAVMRRRPNIALSKWTDSILGVRGGLGLMLAPVLLLATSGAVFKPWLEAGDGSGWNFPRYLIYFFVGYLLITRRQAYYAALERIRVPATILAPALTVLWRLSVRIVGVPGIELGGWAAEGYPAANLRTLVGVGVQSAHEWMWCLLVFSWAARLLTHGNVVLTYLNSAVYPAFIVHYHVTIVTLLLCRQVLSLDWVASLVVGPIIVVIGSLLIFELLRRAHLFRILLAVRGEPAPLRVPHSRAERRGPALVLIHCAAMGALGALVHLADPERHLPAAWWSLAAEAVRAIS